MGGIADELVSRDRGIGTRKEEEKSIIGLLCEFCFCENAGNGS